MSSNISGFQGVNTPLQSMTNGKYTLADYTKMNTVFGARITALEKATAFNPNNVTIGGSLSIQPNSTQAGTLTVASNGTINGSLTVAKTLTVTQNAIVNGTLSVAGGITFNTLAVNNLNTISIVNSGAITSGSVTAATLSGNGASITSVQAVSAPNSGLTGVVPTWNQSTTGNALTATNVPYTGLTGVVPTWNQNTSGSSFSSTRATNLAGGAPGQILYQSGLNTTLFTAAGTFGQVLTSQGAMTPIWSTSSLTDPTKLPLAGGTMTGILNFSGPPSTSYAQNYKKDQYINWDNPVGGTLIPVNQNQSVHDYIRISYANGACTVNLQNFAVDNAAYHQDYMRRVTIVKKAMALGDYVVTLLPPTGYLFYDKDNNGVAVTTIPLGRFSATYCISIFTGVGCVDLISFT
jgi:hypothetical protein